MISHLVNLLFPETCVCCEKVLEEQEPHICGSCLLELPILEPGDENAFRKLAGRVKIETATAYLKFNKLGKAQQILHEIKYKNNEGLGKYMGALFFDHIKEIGLEEKIDVLIPVPLHHKRLKIRTYNQAEAIAFGIGTTGNIPLDTTSLVKTKEAVSQTRKGRIARLENMQNCFSVVPNNGLVGKHIGLVDDVMTTGATLEACCNCLIQSGIEKITVLSLAVA